MDFTLQDGSQLDEAFLKEQFFTIAEWLYEVCGIVIPTERLNFDIYQNPRGYKSCTGRVYYQSYFSSGKRSIPKIKLDLTVDEIMVMNSSLQKVSQVYTDAPSNGIYANCYSYPEIFAEKIRALSERGRPRDLYDVINLYRNGHLPDLELVQDALIKKCAYKNIGLPTLEVITSYQSSMLSNWNPMLAHQLPALPSLDVYWNSLPEFFNWLEGREIQQPAALGLISEEGQVYQPLYGQLNLRTLSGNSLEIIRFAAGNRLCIDLDYTDDNGYRTHYIIEPYSLRRMRSGEMLLYTIHTEDNQTRVYKVNQINNVFVTNKAFNPRYRIELNSSDNVNQS